MKVIHEQEILSQKTKALTKHYSLQSKPQSQTLRARRLEAEVRHRCRTSRAANPTKGVNMQPEQTERGLWTPSYQAGLKRGYAPASGLQSTVEELLAGLESGKWKDWGEVVPKEETDRLLSSQFPTERLLKPGKPPCL